MSDRIIAGVLLALLCPFIALRLGLSRSFGDGCFRPDTFVGLSGRRVSRLRMSGPWPGSNLLMPFNVLRGEMALVGTRTEDGVCAQATCPGLISPTTARERLGIVAATEPPHASVDSEPLGFRDRFTVIAKALLTLPLKAGDHLQTPGVLRLFDLSITNTDSDEAVAWAMQQCDADRPRNLFFVNAHCLNVSRDDALYKSLLLRADRLLPDGVGVALAARMNGWRMRTNLNGTDLFPQLISAAAREHKSIFLLGGRPGVATIVARSLQRSFPRLRIVGNYHGYFGSDEEADIIEAINRSGADILFVAMGVPTQERWIARHHATLKAPLRVAVGGLFDFYSGRIPRAPLGLREVGLEWLWRLWQEPGRMWRRYVLGNPRFLVRAFLLRGKAA